MTEYSRSAKGSFTQAATGNNVAIYLPFQPTLVKLTNYTAYANFAASDIPWGTWDVAMGQGTAAVGYIGAGPVLQTAVVTANGISTFAAGLMLQFGPVVLLGGAGGITKHATTPTVTTTANHNLNTGDVVVFENLYEIATTGMQQIAGIPFAVTVLTGTTFTIAYDTSGSNFTAITAGGLNTLAQFKKVLYPDLYLPGVTNINFLALGTTTTVTTTTNHNYVVGQEIAFRVPLVYGTAQLNSLPNNTIPGSPIYGYVTSVTSNTQFVCNINSTGFSAFVVNQPFASFRGLQFPQVVAVGDVNSGGWPYTGGNLYPSPSFPTFSGGVSTINGPAIQGAFVNNTRQGFIIGAGNAVFQATPDTSSHLSGETSDVIYWEAFLTDISSP